MSPSAGKPFELTASLEDYLEAIKELIDEDPHGHAHTSEIARRLKVKMPSVTNALGVLRRNGYLNYDSSYPVTLTEAGTAAAARVSHRHKVLKTFLNSVLLLPEGDAGKTACRMEHVIDEQLIARLEALNNLFMEEDCGRTLGQRLKQALSEIEHC